MLKDRPSAGGRRRRNPEDKTVRGGKATHGNEHRSGTGQVKDVIILHEYGARRHFDAIYRLQTDGVLGSVRLISFNVAQQFGRSILHHNLASLSSAVRNLLWLARLLAAKGEIVIAGAAPYDPIVSLLLLLKKRNRLVYFTSWPYWCGERQPKQALCSSQRKQWFRFVDGVQAVAVTEAARGEIAALGAKAVHIPHSVDTDVFKPHEDAGDAETVRFLFVGKMSAHKGVDLLIDLVREKRWANTEYWFVGDGRLAGAVTALVREGYPVRHFGYVKDKRYLAGIYRDADVFVLPSRRGGTWEELFGIAIIEAMASGLPAIVTDCIGPREIVRSGYDGLIVPQGSKSELAKAMDVLVRDRKQRRAMAEAARRTAESKYDVLQNALRWKTILLSE